MSFQESFVDGRVSILLWDIENEYSLISAVNSINIQNYPNLEVIIICNKSLLSVLNLGAINVQFVWDEQLSEMQLFEIALLKISGEYTFVLRGNSSFESNSVLSELIEIAKRDDCQVVYGNIKRVFPNSYDDILIMPEVFSAKDIFYEKINFFYSSIIKTDLLIKNFERSNNFKLTLDWLFLVKLFLFDNINYKFKNTVVVRINVNLAGGIYKLSNGHLRVIEKDKVVKKALSPQLIELFAQDNFHAELLNSSKFIILANKLENIKTKLFNRFFSIKQKTTSLINTVKTHIYLKRFLVQNKKNIYNIPIIINNRNHLTYLLRLISSLEKRGYKNIYIIDNDSDYQPLLEFYENCDYKVYLLEKNVGFCALWDTTVFNDFQDTLYVYTDSDIELVEECPNNFLGVLQYFLEHYEAGKIGLSLLINDLPDYFKGKAEVIKWESKFSAKQEEELLYNAPVDTTFALYKPNAFGYAGMISSFRTKYPYSASHLPWYEDTDNLTLEQMYYYRNAKTSTHWSEKISIKK